MDLYPTIITKRKTVITKNNIKNNNAMTIITTVITAVVTTLLFHA